MASRAYISKLRRRDSFKRKPGDKKPRSITLIVCEGETEQEYFEVARDHFKLTRAEVIVAENTIGSAPTSVVECATKKSQEPGGYDVIYCVFDRDTHQSFQSARDAIRELSSRTRKPVPLREAISIPCFEFWVLLHFEQTDAPFNSCDDVIRRIRATHLPNYEKADATVARQLMGDLNSAMTNAQWLEQRAADNNYNPYTSIHHLMQHFKAVAQG